MSELVWIHRFNGNELGLRGAGGFCLVPVEARNIFFPNRDFSVNPDIKETVHLTYTATNEKIDLTYGKPPSKSEHRLSLTGNVLKEYIGNDESESSIKPGKIGCFFRKNDEIFLSIADSNSAYGKLLDLFPVRGNNNNLVTKTILDSEAIENNKKYYITEITKPFLLLAGISGTGKTRFVRKQAEFSGDLKETYCLTAVRPDWHEPSDLLGYVSRLSGKSEYVITDVLKFIVKSWLEIKQSGITLTKNSATGSKAQQQQIKPFWLCLDEMNLAPVEQYFADYLSVLETREWLWNNEAFTYQCDPLLKPSIFDDIEQDKLKKELGLEGHDDLWQHFLENGISIPFNLIVAGTVNMDETTHGFSRKVIDRALTFDFGEFFPNDFTEFFEPTNTPEILGYPVLTDGRDKAALSTTFDSDGSLSIALLESINLVLTNTPFKLAYRALNELLLSVISHKPKTAIELAAVWDDFLMCKVLPRIEGDIDKLTKGGEDKNILEQLDTLLSEQLKTIWDGEVRPDLFRKSLENDQPIEIECRAKAKLDWMRAQLVNGFTSFWP